MRDAETLTMSAMELDRLEIIGRVVERRLTQRMAAERLGLSLRHVERLCRAFRRHGAAGLVSRKRGHPSNRKLAEAVREQAVDLVRGYYSDFGPTLACEKLTEQHGFTLSRETLRRWMTEAGLWVPRAQRHRRAHQPRHRRACLGELIQIDGCEHAWFEDRGPTCTLLVYVDDATSRLLELRIVASESTFDYFASTRAYLEHHGKPVAFYSDKASIFRVGAPEAATGAGMTQFGRALAALNIDIVCANTPQAKGRVERAHLTLQDRLVKEFRLRPAPQGFLGHLIAREYSQEECRNGEARSRCGGGGGSPEGDRRCCRERPWGTVFGPAQARDGAASAARRGS